MEHQTLEDVAMVDGMPQWLAEMDELAGDDLDPPRMAAAPRPVPLLPWSRLWPFLRAALGSDAHLGHIDFSAVVDRLARGRAVRRLPRVRLSGWARRCRLLLDFDDRLIPFRQDIRDTWRGLKRLRGEEGMEAIVLQAGPDGAWRKAGKRSPRIRGNLLPETGSAVLVLGDLGTCDAAPQTMEPWVRLGRRLRRHGVLPVALTPSPPRTWPGELLDHWRIFSWDRGTRLPRLRSSLQRSLHGRPECRMPVNPEDMTDQAATLLSAAILVEPALLRAIRLLLPGADVGVESAVWQLDYAISSPLGLVFEKDTLIRLQGRFSDHPLRELAVDRIGRYTDSLPPSVQCEQWLTYADFCPADQDRPEVRWARAYAGRLARTCYEDRHAMDPGRRQWFTRVLLRSNPQFWKNRSMAVGLVASNLDARKAGKFELPREIVPEDVKWMLGDKEETLIWTIRLRDGELMLDPKRGGQQNARGGWPPVDVRVGEFKASRRWAHIVTAEIGVGALVAELYPDKSNAVPMPPKGGMIISTDQEEVLVGMLERPEWASEMGCDQYGLYLAFMVAGVMQRMRWIPPGTFAMGSPEDERDRFENERQHQVTLTPGFWLADTACTQALWQAVTGEVPSHFKGHERPVENVSWEGCWEFIDKINDESAGLELRLPSEAEWEYACRAGKATPFSFGQNITPDEVNYDGNRPYADGKKGQDRSETIEVESLPCNPWGLYEMHGNVWEWCSDWYVDYPDGDATDPVGPEAGENRVLRGGSWASHGRNVRSAYRYYVHPGYRNDTFGFRLARGPLRSSGPGGAVRAPDEPTGRRPEGGGAVTLRLRKRKPVLPEWAIGGGEDDFGRYAEFEVISAIRINSAVQRMRWIAPGSFLMGSPDG
jgi:formylglycine-generating enzyme required for sulfatase activity